MDDLEDLLGAGAYGYFAGGAGDELTLRANETSWSDVRLAPKVLVDVGERDLSVELLGRRRAHPLVVAPMAYQRHAHEDAERGTAQAAAATGSTFVLSSQTTTAPRDVAEVAGPDRWFQLYVFKDRQVSLDLVAEARESGYEALVLTVDFPVAGWRERDKRTGFSVTHPIALNPGGTPLTTEQIFAMHDPTLTWDDVHAFAEAAGMPLLLKGILRPDDAERAVDVGAAGVIVSRRAAVLVDGGIRRGWDVAKALCLGADAALVGRPVLWGLARDGRAGAQAVLEQLVAELDSTLALLGCPRAADLDLSFLA